MHGDKPVVLFFPFNLLSHYLRCLELADSIRENYSVMFAGASRYNSFIEQRGYSVFECENYDADEMIDCASRFDFSWINEPSIERIFLSQVQCIKQLRPAIVVGDGVNTLKMAAEVAEVKYLSLLNGYLTKYYSLIRDVPSGHPAAKYSKQLHPKVYAGIIRFAEKLAFRQVHAPFKKIRKKHKLRKLYLLPDEMEGDLNIILDLPDLFPQKDLPSHYYHAGPVFFTGNARSLISIPANEKPSILVSMGSSGNWKHAAYLNDSRFSNYNIIAAGDSERVLNAGHIEHFSFVSGEEAWKNVKLVICHGGNGTIYQALSRGVPVLCRTYLFEQEYNARRIEQLGLGECIDHIASPMALREIVDRWIGMKTAGAIKSIACKIDVEETKRRFADGIRSVVCSDR